MSKTSLSLAAVPDSYKSEQKTEDRRADAVVVRRAVMVVPLESICAFRHAHPFRLVWWLRADGWQQVTAVQFRRVRQTFIYLGLGSFAGEKS
ncbi:MAG TPA: hypothetical protein DD473_21900 [Planctomycetaceae bacterium]|nr:hypothetical protein [Planctomycetaceae bacterium]|tara:strand:- start:244 stop:519 length:276 start_codon:yes stop_codon:yes gene_type:complete